MALSTCTRSINTQTLLKRLDHKNVYLFKLQKCLSLKQALCLYFFKNYLTIIGTNKYCMYTVHGICV